MKRYPSPSSSRSTPAARVLLSLLLAGTAHSLHAASTTWSATSTDANWSTGANWAVGTAPGTAAGGYGNASRNNDIATFNTSLTADIGSSTNPIIIDANRFIKGITFDTSSVGAFTIGTTAGNLLQLDQGGSIVMNASVTSSQVINAPISIRAQSSFNPTYTLANNATDSAATLTLGGTIATNSSTGRGVNWVLDGTNTGDNTLSGVMSGGGSGGFTPLTKNGTGTWKLTAANTLGSVVINNGTLIAGNTNAFGIGVTTVNGGTLQVDNVALASSSVALNNGGTLKGSGANASIKAVAVNAAALNVNFTTGAAEDVLAVGLTDNSLSGGQASTVISVSGPGTVALGSASSYAGNWSLNSGTTRLGNAAALGANTTNVAFGAASTAKLQLNGNNVIVGGLSSNATLGTPVIENGAAGTATLTVNNASASSYAGTLQDGSAGLFALTKSGAGTLTLSGNNTYTGGTAINIGTIDAKSANALGTGTVTIGSSGTLAADLLNTGNLTLAGGANILLADFDSRITSSSTVSISGSGNVITLGGDLASAGSTYTLVSAASLSATGLSLTGTGVGGLNIAVGDSATVGRTTYAFTSTLTSLQLAITGGAFNLTWNGGNANWNASDANWQKDGTGSNITFVTGDNIIIGTGDTIAVAAGGITAGTLAVTNISGTTTLNGDTLNVLSLAKSGAGTLQLNNAVNSNGATSINAGTIALGSTGSLASGSLAVNGGTLDIGTANASAASVSLTGGSITGTTGVLTSTGSAFDVQSGTISARLAGSVGLTKTTSGTVTLSGANTYTGASTINDGKIVLGGSGTLGNGGGALSLGGGALDLGGTSQTVGAVTVTSAAASGHTIENGSLTGDSYAVGNASGDVIISASLLGSGGLDKTGAGTLTLSGANTYAGTTAVKNGTLILDGGDDRLASTGSVVLGDTGFFGKLVLGGTTVANQTLVSLTSAGSGGSVVGGNAANSTLTMDVAGTTNLAATVGGAGTNENNLALAKNGVGTLTLSSANTFSGGITVNAGTLSLNNSTAAGSGTITAKNGTTLNAAAGVGGNAVGNAITLSGTNANVTLTNANASGGFTGIITGTTDQTLSISNSSGQNVNLNATSQQLQNFFGTVSIASGSTLAFRATSLNNGGDNATFQVDGFLSTRNNGFIAMGALTGSGTVSMGGSGSNNGTLTYTIGAKNIDSTFSGVIQEADALNGKRVNITKVGTGSLTLSGVNTYTGATSITGGTLIVNGSLANTVVTVGVDGTLAGSGTLGGATTVNGALNPGNSPGVLTFSTDLTLVGTANFELNSAVRGTGYDAVNVGGTLTYGGLLNLTFDSTFLAGGEVFTLFAGLNGADAPLDAGSFTAIELLGAYTGALVNDSGVWTGTAGGIDFTFTQDTGLLTAVLSGAPIPEPATYATLAGLAILAFAATRRRRS